MTEIGLQRDPEAEGARLLSSVGDGQSQASGSSRYAGRLRRAFHHCWHHEPLLLATLAGVAVGVVAGTGLSFAHLSPLALEIIGLPGDLLMRTLKMLVLPLITASVMAGVCALRQSTADMGKVARYTLLYYFTTTMGAVVLGIVIVSIVRPGRGSPFDQLDPAAGGAASCHAGNQAKVAQAHTTTSATTSTSGGGHSPMEAFLGVIKSAFPENVFQAAASMNVLGIITVSLLMGAALSCMGPEAAPMVTLINVFNDAISKIVNWVIWTSPVGIASLITTSICRACNLGATLVALGLFICVVLLGLVVWGFLALPAIYFATTRRNPAEVYRGFSQAMATAFGTDSSNATLPITMRSAVALGCDPRVVQFFLPLGTTVNMNGTALYEAVTVIFIAQAHGVVLGAAGTVIVALTATLAAVGAAGIPSAGLVTMLMVLQAVELEQFAGDIAVILAVDWFLDRCRTVVNVLGDSFGTVIIDHHARKWVVGGVAAARSDCKQEGSNTSRCGLGGIGSSGDVQLTAPTAPIAGRCDSQQQGPTGSDSIDEELFLSSSGPNHLNQPYNYHVSQTPHHHNHHQSLHLWPGAKAVGVRQGLLEGNEAGGEDLNQDPAAQLGDSADSGSAYTWDVRAAADGHGEQQPVHPARGKQRVPSPSPVPVPSLGTDTTGSRQLEQYQWGNVLGAAVASLGLGEGAVSMVGRDLDARVEPAAVAGSATVALGADNGCMTSGTELHHRHVQISS